LLLLIFLLALTGIATAQDDAPGAAGGLNLEQLTVDLKKLEEDLGRLRNEKLPDEGMTGLVIRVELANRRDRYRTRLKELYDELRALKEAGDERPESEAWLKERLQTDAQVISEEVREAHRILVGYIDALGGGDAAKMERALILMRIELPEADRLYHAMWQGISMRDGLGVDTAEQREAMIDALTLRGQFQGGMLRTISMSVDFATEQVGDQQAAPQNEQLQMFNRLEDVVAASTLVTIDLLERLGQPTTGLREALVVLTGSASGDILNVAVIKRLVATWLESAEELLKEEGPGLLLKLLIIILIVMVARSVSRLAERLTRRALDRSPVQTSNLLKNFFVKTAGTAVFVIGFLVAIAQVGIQVGPLLAGLGIAGFVIGFALQDVLSNFASGMMILIYRPFDVGDFVEAGGVAGKVNDLTLVSTRILTFDNQLLFVPNTKIWGDVIRNVTHQDLRRVDMVFGIGYSDDIARAERILKAILDDHDKVLDDPEYVVKLHELADSSVNFIVRPWTRTEDYWDVYWDVTRQVKERFDSEGVSIPFPQRDIHLYQEETPELAVDETAGEPVSADPASERNKATQTTTARVVDDADGED
jgi:small conductance mechanosensitive channel